LKYDSTKERGRKLIWNMDMAIFLGGWVLSLISLVLGIVIGGALYLKWKKKEGEAGKQ